MLQSLIKYISPKVHWRLGSYNIKQASHACRYTRSMAGRGPIGSTNLVKNCILHTQLATRNCATCRPLLHLPDCQLIHNFFQRDLFFFHNNFTPSQELVNFSRRELHTHSSDKNLEMIFMSRLTYLWTNIQKELLHKLVKTSSYLCHCLHQTSSFQKRRSEEHTSELQSH